MDFNLNDEQQMLREAASRFMREQYGFEARRHLVAKDGWSEPMWSQYAEMGWLGLTVPEADGGLGLGFVETAIVAEEFGRGLALEPLVGCSVLCARLVERADAPGFAEHRARLLAGIADGSVRVSLAHGEPNSRFERALVDAKAQRVDNGWVLDGDKLMVLAAPSAHHFIVSARMDGGVGLFLVDAPAVSQRHYAVIDGSRAGDLTLRQVKVGADALLAGPASALALLDEALDRAALAHVAEGLGAMEAVLDLTAEYIKTRQQFGQPIGKFQALQHRMSEMFVEVQETRSILYRGIAGLDAPAAERQRAVSAAKVVLGHAARFVGGQGIQLHGGIGVTDEYAVGHYYKRLLVLEKLYGDADWHLGRFASSQKAA